MSQVAQQIWRAIYEEKRYKEGAGIFSPKDPEMKAFPQQEDFLRDETPTALARCGNRAGKSFTLFRDLAWVAMMKHPYQKQFYLATDEEYMQVKPRIFWVAAPDLTFLYEVVWEEFLKTFIPSWYYTDDDMREMVQVEELKGRKVIHQVRFRNGDTINFKAYSQNLLSKMGRSVDGVWLDEPPPLLQILIELVVRVLDKGGRFRMGFTPVDVPQDIVDYIDSHDDLAHHRWGMLDNPVFRDNPAKLKRAMSELSHLSESERNMRLNGDWLVTEIDETRIFQGLVPILVDDFPVPRSWRQVRVLDPASHRSGVCIFAEDPKTGIWYVIACREIQWKGVIARANSIERALDQMAPDANYRYFRSIYDNAESWFYAHCENNLGQWQPCLLKNKALLIMGVRNAVTSGQVRFFRTGAAPLIQQIKLYRRKADGTIWKRKDHLVDCLQYFCREIPAPDPLAEGEGVTELERIADAHERDLQKEWKLASQSNMQSITHQIQSIARRARR